MKRRSFFGVVLGLLAAPFACKQLPPATRIGVDPAVGKSKSQIIFCSTPMDDCSPYYQLTTELESRRKEHMRRVAEYEERQLWG